MKKTFYFLFAVACLSSCLKTQYTMPTVDVSDIVLSTHESGNETLSFTANAPWEITINDTKATPGWLKIDVTSGKAGTHAIEVIITEANPSTTDPRTAYVTITSGNFSKTFTITQPANPLIQVTSVTLNKNTAAIRMGDDETLSANISPANATNKNVTWESDNTSVATVSTSGKVTGVAAGTATITATTVDGGLKADCAVTVVDTTVFVTSVTLNKNTAAIRMGDDETLSANINPANATNKNVTWESDNAAVATVSTSGKVTGVAAGTATITATTVDGGLKATCAVTVVVPVSSVSLNKNTAAIRMGDDETLSANINPANATNKNVTWESDNAAVATVSTSGKVTGVAAGTATITATTVDGGLKATCAVTVVVPVSSVSLNKNTAAIRMGDDETLSANINPANATNKNVTWESDNAAVATVSTSGKVTGVAVGTATITARTVDGGLKATCAVTVVVPVSSVSLNKNSINMVVQTSEKLLAMINPANAYYKSVNWSSSNIAVATVDSNGRVTAVGSGTATITVTTTDGNKTASCTVTAKKPSEISGSIDDWLRETGSVTLN